MFLVEECIDPDIDGALSKWGKLIEEHSKFIWSLFKGHNIYFLGLSFWFFLALVQIICFLHSIFLWGIMIELDINKHLVSNWNKGNTNILHERYLAWNVPTQPLRSMDMPVWTDFINHIEYRIITEMQWFDRYFLAINLSTITCIWL